MDFANEYDEHNEFDDNDDNDDDNEGFGMWDGKCQACDAYGPVGDMSLCEECAGKLERDLIRKRDWKYSANAYGCPPERLEELRSQVIRKHGERLELLAPTSPNELPPKSSERKKKRKRRRRRGAD
jgi:hypothetical protein